jgi:hypothetical protein
MKTDSDLVNRLLRLRESLSKLDTAITLIDRAWPEIVGSDPSKSDDLHKLYVGLRSLVKLGEQQSFEAWNKLRGQQ